MKSILIIILLILVCVANCFCQNEDIEKIYPARNFQSVPHYVDVSYEKDIKHFNIGVYSNETGFIGCENFFSQELIYNEDRNTYSIQKGKFIFIFDHNKKLGQIDVQLDHYTSTKIFLKNKDLLLR